MSSATLTLGGEPSLFGEIETVDVADVVVGVEAPELLPTYSYRVPDELRERLKVGTCVHVPFGGRETLGYVFGRRNISASDPLRARLKEVIAIVEDAITFNEEQARCARWISDTYLCDLAAAV